MLSALGCFKITPQSTCTHQRVKQGAGFYPDTGWTGGGSDSPAAVRAAPGRLDRLHKHLAGRIAGHQIKKFVRAALPHGFLHRHAQHLCCELRKWRNRKTAHRGRKRRPGAAQRAKVRARRLRKVWRRLGFSKQPSCP